GGQETLITQRIALDVDSSVVQYRRAGISPFQRRGIIRPDVQHAKVLRPEQLAAQIVAVQALRSKERDQPFTIHSDRGIRIGGLGMSLRLRHPGMLGPLPEDLPGALVQTIDIPLLRRDVRGGVAIAIEPDFQISRSAANSRSDKQLVPPNN